MLSLAPVGPSDPSSLIFAAEEGVLVTPFVALDGPDPEGATRDSPVGYEVGAVDDSEPSLEYAVDRSE